MEKRTAWILLIGSFLLCIGIYTISLDCPKVLDDYHILESSKLKQILDKPFSVGLRRWVSKFTFAINYWTSGTQMKAYRLTNLILHLLTGFTLFTLILHLKKLKNNGYLLSLIVTILWLLHPLQSSTVNYVAQRMAILSALFSILAFLCYIKATEKKGPEGKLWYGGFMMSIVLGILSKENAIMILPMILFYDLVFISELRWKESMKRSLPVAIALSVVVVFIWKPFGMSKFIGGIIDSFLHPGRTITQKGWSGMDIILTPLQFWMTECRVLVRYLIIFFIPLPGLLVFDYSDAYPISQGLFSPPTTIVSIGIIAILLLWAAVNLRRHPAPAFGIFWFFVTISLESFVAVGIDYYFEHRNYLPSIGLAITAGYGITVLLKKWSFRKEVVIASLMILLSVLTYSRNKVWSTDITLWKDTISKVPENIRARITLSGLMIDRGRLEEAERFLEGIDLSRLSTPKKFQVMFNLTSIYKERGRYEEALREAETLLKLKDLNRSLRGKVYYLIGEIYRETGKWTLSEKYLIKAKKSLSDEKVGILISLSQVYVAKREYEKAEASLKEALYIEPANVMANMLLADLYLMINKKVLAEEYYTKVIGSENLLSKDTLKRVYLNLALIKATDRRYQEAMDYLEVAEQIDPEDYLIYIYKGNIYLSTGKPEQAVVNYRKALQLSSYSKDRNPNKLLLYYNLGKAFEKLGDKKEAAYYYRVFLDKTPDITLFKKLRKEAKNYLTSR